MATRKNSPLVKGAMDRLNAAKGAALCKKSMANEKCPKCGTEMEWLPGPRDWICSLPTGACARIAKLERQLEEFASKAVRAGEEGLRLIAERDAALAQVGVLRNAVEAVLAMDDSKSTNRKETTVFLDIRDWLAFVGDARLALSNTSATAQQAVERIKREALEGVVGSYGPILREIVATLKSEPLPLPVAKWQRYQWVLENLAAILGEKNP